MIREPQREERAGEAAVGIEVSAVELRHNGTIVRGPIQRRLIPATAM